MTVNRQFRFRLVDRGFQNRTRRWPLVLLVCKMLTCNAALVSLAYGAPPDPRPNVVLILADDLGYSDLGCYGGEIRTPHLDRLAREGMQFTQFYNCAVCWLTRAAMMTGLHPRHGEKAWLQDGMVTLAEVLREAGYRTASSGKWHLGDAAPRRPTDRGFEEFYGVASGCCNYFDPSQPDPEFYGGKRRTFLHNDQPVTSFPEDYYATDAFADHAVQQIHRFAAGDSPFFLHVAFTAPHFPLHAKPEDIANYQGRYRDGYMRLREQRFHRQRELGILEPHWKLSPVHHRQGDFRYDYEIRPWEDVNDLAREERRMEVYAAMVDCVDQAVGSILRALDDAQVADNTLVMFLSDNGGCASDPTYRNPDVARAHARYNRELPGGKDTYDFCAPGWGWAQCTPFRRYKGWIYEGGIATPMLVRWPNAVPEGSRTDEVAHVVDFMPTLVELAQTRYPERRDEQQIKPMEGHSLVATLQGRERAGHDSLCWYIYDGRAIRQGRWKLVWNVAGQQWELYDMQTDRTETNDVAAQYPRRVARMSNLWHRWARETGVTRVAGKWSR